MKKLLLPAALLLTLSAAAQTKTTTAKPAAKKPAVPAKPAAPKPPAPALKSLTDSASYAIGLSVATFYAQQGMKGVNAAMVARAINDVQGKKTLLIAEGAANDVIMSYMNEAQAAKAQPNIDAGRKFLAANRSKPGVKTTPSGLQYQVLRDTSAGKPSATDTVVVHYAGALLDGSEFDNSYKRGEPATFPVNRVITGWTEALQLMPLGSKYRLWIPMELGYGTNDNGPIPAGSVLVFDVELLDIKKGS